MQAMDYKFSFYTVVTDPLSDGSGKRIIFATRTARSLMVTEALYAKIQQGAWDQIAEATFQKLREFQIVVPADEDELAAVIGRSFEAVDRIDGLYCVIQPTAMCQLGCGYCGQRHTKDYLTPAATSKILERIEGKLQTGAYKALSIGWFGSEPLMGLAQIRDMTPKLIDLAARYNCTYGAKMTTNGLSLKEPIFVECVTKHKINKIEITLDGTAEYHDARRHTKEGLSSFNLIFNNLLKVTGRPDFKQLGCELSVRCNVDARNHESVVPLIRQLAAHNLQDKISYFYVAPIHSWGNDAHLLSLTKEQFADLEIDWLLEQHKAGFNPGLLPGLNPVVCLSVTPQAEVYDAFGNVFDCTEVPYVPAYEGTEYQLGNLNNGLDTISPHRPLLSFHQEVRDGELPCSTCKMLPVCGGGCPKSWREEIAPCPVTKYNIKDKLALQYLFNKKGKEALLEMV